MNAHNLAGTLESVGQDVNHMEQNILDLQRMLDMVKESTAAINSAAEEGVARLSFFPTWGLRV